MLLTAAVILLCCASASATPSLAKKKDRNDFQNWDTVYLTVPVTDKVSTTLEFQNQLKNNWQNESVFFLRPSLNYKISPRLTVSQGYSWNPRFSPDSSGYQNEQRIWEQLQYSYPLRDNVNLTLRTRLEQRFFEGASRVGVRFRGRVKLTRPIPIRALDRRNYYLVTYDELRLNLNTVSGHAHSGIDSNRAFVGIGKKIGQNAKLETGYLLQYNRKVDASDTFTHALLFSLSYSTPQLFHRDQKVVVNPLTDG